MIKTNQFLCDFWTDEHCDSQNWGYIPSTYGVSGVTLVGKPHMMLIDEIDCSWINPGRKYGTNDKDINKIVDNISENGINSTSGTFIYVEDETNSRVNGAHRIEASKILDIPGWMIQRVRFDNVEAKIKFANCSNIIEELPHTNPTPKDIETAVAEIVTQTKIFTEDKVRDDVAQLGKHLTQKQRDKIVDALLVNLYLNGKVTSLNRYISISGSRASRILEQISDAWIDKYWNVEEEHTLYINSSQVESRVGGIISANVAAVKDGKPLHIIFSVSPPEGKKNTLESNRNSFWTTQMKSIEDRVMDCCGVENNFGRRNFAWNHPDAKHRTFGQDTSCEDIRNLIVYESRNRGFN